MTDYVSLKFALLGLIKVLALEYGNKNIQVIGISPEMIDINYIKELPSYIVENEIKGRASQWLLTVDDDVPIFKWLLSSDADSVSGQNIVIA